ncbi:MAG: DUF3794 domain-containing protein, partial [Lachnospiraceae bacterium]|nr:DUF3794 domain-containing protein [Lachnospiraceae bacterium]
MDLLMKKIHMCRQAKSVRTQVTLDEDFNVPDVRPDVEEIIQSRERVTLEHTRAESGKLYLDGFMDVSILYLDDTQEKGLHRLDTKLPFDEVILMEKLMPGETVRVRHETEDLNVSLINSRKLAIRALVSLEASVDEIYDLSAAVEVRAPGSTDDDDNFSHLADGAAPASLQRNDVYGSAAGTSRTDEKNRMPVLCEKKEKLEFLQLEVQNKDILRLKEDVPIASNKANIREILWENIQLRGCRTQLL